MARPDERKLSRLPMLAPRASALETCAYCPKLCRSACPVSNADPRETVTPWGKMSMAYFAARGDVALAESFAKPAWACTGCHACRETCDHKNEVASTLFDARSALVEAGVAPEAAKRTIARFDAHAEDHRDGVRRLRSHARVADAPDALLVGCAYVKRARPEAEDAIEGTAALVGGKVGLADECCGMPLLHAGDARAFRRQAERFAEKTARAERVLVADAGCAMALRVRYPEMGVKLGARVELVVELAARELGKLSPVEGAGDGPVRWHDPCQLGRGLGIYEAPRAVLTRALGRAPDEFDARREKGGCSGGGGLLPVTMPGVARGIAQARLAEHDRNGGGRVVTGCASSLHKLRRARPGAQVDDLLTWIARASRPRKRIG